MISHEMIPACGVLKIRLDAADACSYTWTKSSRSATSANFCMQNFQAATSPKLESLLKKIKDAPETLMLDEALDAIAEAYDFTPVAFSNGPLRHAAGEKIRSCMLYAFGRLHGLDVAQTLACFGEHYREVLKDPTGDSHMTIRVFMKGGWSGVQHASMPLSPRAHKAAGL